jgi:DNA-binding NarL/FixJ family response regulator
VAEWERVRTHPYLTDRILSQCDGLAPIARLASSDHERIDGSGYHRSVDGTALDASAVLLQAADVVVALGEDRPHRPAWADDEVVRTAVAEAQARRLDAHAVDAVLASAGHGEATVPGAGGVLPDGMTARELEVLQLIARGRTNKEVAAELHLSAKTVGRHIENLYTKLDVHSRAAAAVYAMENRLL